MGTILITGGAGFIGSHLTEALLKKNYSIVVLDNFNDYYDPKIKQNNIKEIEIFAEENGVLQNLKVIKGDIRNSETLDFIFSENSIDLVVHLAAMAGVRPSIKDPILYNDVNITGTTNLLEFCKKNRVNKFIFASSSSIYGNNKKVPFCETDVVDYPISPYAATKKAGELLCHTYHNLYEMDMACLRFFTVYGPRQRPDLAIHKFTNLMYHHNPIPFYGDGLTERDYTFIDDIIDGILKTINWIQGRNGVYEIFNIGESQTISLSQMVKMIEKHLKINASLDIRPLQPGDVNRTYANINKAKKVIGYNPSTSFEAGVEKFIKWYIDSQELK